MTVAPDWINNHEIDTPPTPLTSHGPAMCYYNNDAYVLYIGQHGKNIWSLKNEGENTQVKIGQQTPRSSFRPALAVFDGMLHMVYVGEEGRSLWWSWFDGTSWHGNVQLPFAAYEPQPSLAAFGGALHLVWHDSNVPKPAVIVVEMNTLYYSKLLANTPLEATSWGAPQPIGQAQSFPALADFNNSLYLVAQDPYSPQFLLNRLVNNDWTGWSDWIAPKSETPESRNGAALLVLGAYLYLVYPGEAGKNLWCAWIDENGGHFGNIQIETTDGSGTPRTSDVVGAASDGQSLWVSFKAESSDRLCMVQSSP